MWQRQCFKYAERNTRLLKTFQETICCTPAHWGLIIGIPESFHENIETEENIQYFPLKHSAKDQRYIIYNYRLKDQ